MRRADATADTSGAVPADLDAGTMAMFDATPFACGTISGAIAAKLTCYREYPALSWDYEPTYAYLGVTAVVVRDDAGMDAGVLHGADALFVVSLLTPPPTAPLSESCSNLPALPSGAWSAFRAGFSTWYAACNSATDVTAGSSFALIVNSVGQFTTAPPNVDPLDAGPDGFDWSMEKNEVLTDSFHGELKVTLVSTDGAAPIMVSLAF